jgi:hypothetical protein
MWRRGGRARVGTASGLVVGLPVALVLAGCGADVERQEAASAADRFAAEVTADPAGACALLAPRTLESLEQEGESCAQALPEADLPSPGARGKVSVAGHSAQVRYAQETVFLSLFDDGWRVTAAGCTRTSSDSSVPYDCMVEGD